MIIAAQVITASRNYFTVRPCAQLAYISQDIARSYASCAPYFDGTDRNALAIVNANFGGSPAEIGVALGMPFGSAIWLALAIHAIGVEVYVSFQALHLNVHLTNCRPAQSHTCRDRTTEADLGSQAK